LNVIKIIVGDEGGGMKKLRSPPEFSTNLNLTYEKLAELFGVGSALIMKKLVLFYTTNIALSFVKGSQHKLKKVKILFLRVSKEEI